MTKPSRLLLAITLVGLTALALARSPAEADHVRMNISGDPAHPSPDVIQPGPSVSTSYTPAAPRSTFEAGGIEAQQILARIIYANRIEADEIHGEIHQTKGINIGDDNGDIKASHVSASVIYADEINANSVVADQIFVRDLRPR